MKFLIFSNCDSGSHHGCSYLELSKITMPSYKEYCDIHGYDFYFHQNEGTERMGRLSGYAKYDVFLERLKDYDWVFSVECDSMLMNQTIRLENLIDDYHNIVLSRTSNPNLIELNTGPILIKNCEWSINLVKRILEKKEYYNHQMVDQASITDEVNGSSDILSRCKIMPLRFFNSFYHAWHSENNFRVGDFICHAAGASNDYRAKLFSFLSGNIIKIPKYTIPLKPFLNIGDEL